MIRFVFGLSLVGAAINLAGEAEFSGLGLKSVDLIGSDGSFVIGHRGGDVIRLRSSGEADSLGALKAPRGATADGEMIVSGNYLWSSSTGSLGAYEIPGLGDALVAGDVRDVKLTDISADGSTLIGFGNAVFAPYPEVRSTVGIYWNEVGGLRLLYSYVAGDVGGGVFPEYLSADGMVFAGADGFDRASTRIPELGIIKTWTVTEAGIEEREDAFRSARIDGISRDGLITYGMLEHYAGSSYVGTDVFLSTDVEDSQAQAVLDLLRRGVPEWPGRISSSIGPPARLQSAHLSGDGLVQAYNWEEGLFLATPDFQGLLTDFIGSRDELSQAVAGWSLTEVVDISDDGSVLVGNGKNPEGADEAWRLTLAPVPEPSAAWLAALSVIAAAATIKRRSAPAT